MRIDEDDNFGCVEFCDLDRAPRVSREEINSLMEQFLKEQEIKKMNPGQSGLSRNRYKENDNWGYTGGFI